MWLPTTIVEQAEHAARTEISNYWQIVSSALLRRSSSSRAFYALRSGIAPCDHLLRDTADIPREFCMSTFECVILE